MGIGMELTTLTPCAVPCFLARRSPPVSWWLPSLSFFFALFYKNRPQLLALPQHATDPSCDIGSFLFVIDKTTHNRTAPLTCLFPLQKRTVVILLDPNPPLLVSLQPRPMLERTLSISICNTSNQATTFHTQLPNLIFNSSPCQFL